MVVTVGTLKCEGEERLSKRVGPVRDVLDAVFLLDDASLLRDLVIAVEAGGQYLFLGGIGQQVTGQLPGDELIVRVIFVERVDHPIAPRPHGAQAVVLVAVGIGIAGDVHPVDGHLFPILGLGQQLVHHLLIRLGGWVLEKTLLQIQRWR